MVETGFRFIAGTISGVESYRCVKLLIVEQREQRYPESFVCAVDTCGCGGIATEGSVSHPHAGLSVRWCDAVDNQFGASVINVMKRRGDR